MTKWGVAGGGFDADADPGTTGASLVELRDAAMVVRPVGVIKAA